jgi:hypothetical protein
MVMENKYNLDFNLAMDSVNDYYDVIEDNMYTIKKEFKDNPEHLEVILNQMKNDSETMDDLEKKALVYLIEGDHQSFLEQLLLNDIYMVFIEEVLPGDDLSILEFYIESFNEEEIINEVNMIIDSYLN